MCKVSDIVLEVKTLTDGEIYSIRTLQEIRDTFPKKDVIGIENTDGYYANSTGKYKICSSDSELLFVIVPDTQYLPAPAQKLCSIWAA